MSEGKDFGAVQNHPYRGLQNQKSSTPLPEQLSQPSCSWKIVGNCRLSNTPNQSEQHKPFLFVLMVPQYGSETVCNGPFNAANPSSAGTPFGIGGPYCT